MAGLSQLKKVNLEVEVVENAERKDEEVIVEDIEKEGIEAETEEATAEAAEKEDNKKSHLSRWLFLFLFFRLTSLRLACLKIFYRQMHFYCAELRLL